MWIHRVRHKSNGSAIHCSESPPASKSMCSRTRDIDLSAVLEFGSHLQAPAAYHGCEKLAADLAKQQVALEPGR